MPTISGSDLTGMDIGVVDEDLGKMQSIKGEMNATSTEVQKDAQSTREMWQGQSQEQFQAKMDKMGQAFTTFEDDWGKITKFIDDVKEKYVELDQRGRKRFGG